MVKTFSVLFTVVLFASCNSGKSEKETNATDTITSVPVDTTKKLANDTIMPTAGGWDKIGDLWLGLVDTKVIEALGQPESKGKNEEWGADGMFHQDWNYNSKGIALNMSGEKNNGLQQIFSITVTGPATLKTPVNIGIGSDINDVKKAYANNMDPSSTDESIVVGSVYGGIIFNFKNGKVDKIFVGAAAE
jgi:hypothetical protein